MRFFPTIIFSACFCQVKSNVSHLRKMILLWAPSDTGFCSTQWITVLHHITGKVPNCSDNKLAQNWRVSNIAGYAGPQSNTRTPLLQHSVLSPAQGTADQSCYLTRVRCATVVLCGSNVPEIAQAVEKGEVILWALYLDAALHSPGPPAAQPALQGSLWRSSVSFSLQRTSKNNSNCGHLKVFTKGRKATLKQVAEKEVTAMKKMQRKCQKADAVILSPNTQLHGTSCPEDELQGSQFSPKPFGWNICGVTLCWVTVSL